MTLIAAWIRCTPGGEELVVSSDSRITGGIMMNHAPKIFRLKRGDAVLAYCGPTLVAYPILIQIQASLDAHEETRSRIVDIVHLKSHIRKTIELLRLPIEDLPSKDDSNRSFKFLLAGYSWKTATFRVWTFRYDIRSGEFNAFSMPRKHRFVFMSDCFENERDATVKLLRRMANGGNRVARGVDWEPLEVLFGFIRDPSLHDIGGPPQIVKVYKHANTLPINVIWPDDEIGYRAKKQSFQITHLGRPLLGYEKTRYLTLDPETMDLVEPWKIRDRIKQCNDSDEARRKHELLRLLCCALAELRKKKDLQERLTEMVANKMPFEEMDRLMRQFKSNKK